MINLSLLLLHYSYSHIASPLLQSTERIACFSLFSTHIYNHFSSFISFSNTASYQGKIDIFSCRLEKFLSSTINFYDSPTIKSITYINGINNSNEHAAATPTVSFTCINSVFAHNSIMQNGAAICISLSYGIDANIQSSKFMENYAYFGGALYFLFENGNLTINNTIFYSNDAKNHGSHIFLSYYNNIVLSNNNFLLGHGLSIFCLSVMKTTYQEYIQLYFNSCRFFQNCAPLYFASDSFISFEGCCFVQYNQSNSNHDVYITKNLFDSSNLNVTLTFIKCCVNFGYSENTVVHANDAEQSLQIVADNQSNNCEDCRLIPLATATINVKISSLASIEAIIALLLCILISIIGIIIVVCMNHKKNHKYNESLTIHQNI
ncbi:hypothetical protein TRFO_31797 [Tritrichomonas foetus]|uniref:Right handed beta helix domain-containing protein n=1 Tax=Tritrichomonas foetus TaxID=1144522 RepID=A0A1J4JV53_9EUKA|nr:hypothetical protein TRFO_31797 [Tritrichomonas foetus]|eukprot:OHT01414.1 hypothetical protein TRFO_31797 [Tritrichomonas foetus]